MEYGVKVHMREDNGCVRASTTIGDFSSEVLKKSVLRTSEATSEGICFPDRIRLCLPDSVTTTAGRKEGKCQVSVLRLCFRPSLFFVTCFLSICLLENTLNERVRRIPVVRPSGSKVDNRFDSW